MKFDWKALRRIARRTFSRKPETAYELEDFFYCLLRICAATYGVMRGYDFVETGRDFAAAYFVMRVAIGDLGHAARIFPQHTREMLVMFLQEILLGTVGEVHIPDKPPAG